MEVKLWEHQKRSIELAKNKKNFAFFLPVGTGKTLTVIELLRYHYNTNKRVMRTLVISPLIVTRNWMDEIAKHTKIPKEKYKRLEGSILERASQLKDFEGLAIVNYDAFVNQKFVDAVLAWNPEILVLDELHAIKNFQSKRTKSLMKISEKMGKDAIKYGMTGTPVANELLDLWSQFYVLDLGETLGKSFYGFRGHFFRNINSHKSHLTFPLWVKKPGAEEAIAKMIAPKSISVKKEECLDLPPLIEKTIEVELTPEQRSVYKQMKDDLIAFIENKACVAQLAITKALRLQQIVSGYLPMEDGSVKHLSSNRPKALRDLLEIIPSNEKVIIWAVFREDYKTVAECLRSEKITYKEAHGLISEKEKNESLEAFRKDPSVRALIASPAAIGVGINLVESAYSIWFSRNFSMDQDEQAAARNYRGGSERHESITRFDLVARDTIDEVVVDAVRKKYNIANKILQNARSIL